jgi:hypothetical protein
MLVSTTIFGIEGAYSVSQHLHHLPSRIASSSPPSPEKKKRKFFRPKEEADPAPQTPDPPRAAPPKAVVSVAYGKLRGKFFGSRLELPGGGQGQRAAVSGTEEEAEVDTLVVELYRATGGWSPAIEFEVYPRASCGEAKGSPLEVIAVHHTSLLIPRQVFKREVFSQLHSPLIWGILAYMTTPDLNERVHCLWELLEAGAAAGPDEGLAGEPARCVSCLLSLLSTSSYNCLCFAETAPF